MPALLKMQNLATHEEMAAVILQFLQDKAHYKAGVAVTPNKAARGKVTWR